MNRSEFLKVLGVTAASTMIGGLKSVANTVNQVGEPAKKISSHKRSQEAIVDKPVTAIVIGAGARGQTYAEYADFYPKSMKIVGVSDINKERKLKVAKKYGIPEKYQFGDWSEVFKVPRFADAVIVSTSDNLHYTPCMKALEMGYDVLLEKPIAQTAQECVNILNQAKKYNRIVGVCHVLRYAPYFLAMKEVLDSGTIGDVVSVQHMEPIRFHHMAHSYVRGNWRSSKDTTPIILAKSCHDLDMIRWLLGKKCEQVSAFGELSFFKKENAPAGSAVRCMNCSIERKCPFSAIKIYLEERKYLYVFDLPEDQKLHKDIILNKIRTTNYGQCVFHSDNDQCDHYVVNMEFKDGLTAAFSMEGLTSYGGRQTRIMGTKGDIVGDMTSFKVTDFLTNKQSIWNEDISDLPGYEGHAGGDMGIVRDFVLAVNHHSEDFLSSKIEVSVESHLMGFKAEQSRLEHRIIKV